MHHTCTNIFLPLSWSVDVVLKRGGSCGGGRGVARMVVSCTLRSRGVELLSGAPLWPIFFFIAISSPSFRSNMLFIYLYLHLYGNMITGFFHRRKFVRKGKKKYRMREISYNKLISRFLFFFFSFSKIYIYIIKGSKMKSGLREERLSFSRQVSSKQVIEVFFFFFFFLTSCSWQEREENGRERLLHVRTDLENCRRSFDSSQQRFQVLRLTRFRSSQLSEVGARPNAFPFQNLHRSR